MGRGRQVSVCVCVCGGGGSFFCGVMGVMMWRRADNW